MKKGWMILVTTSLFLAIASLMYAAEKPCLAHDINCDNIIGLEDAIAALKHLAHQTQANDEQAMNIEHVANFNTRALAYAQNDIANLEQLTSVLSMIPFPASAPPKKNITESLFDMFMQANISCADISQDENGIIITFNENPLCLGMKGSIHVSVTDHQYLLEFYTVSQERFFIDGNVRLSIAHAEEIVFAELSFENMSINHHPIDGEYSVSFDNNSGLISTVDFKEKIQLFEINGQAVQAHFQAVYDKLTGFLGSSQMTLNGQTFKSQFNNFFTDPINGLPSNGSMTINDIQLFFQQHYSKNNPVVSYLINDVPVNLKLTTNKIQQGAKNFAQQITNFATSLLSGEYEKISYIESLTEIFSKMDITKLIQNLKQTQSRTNVDPAQIIQDINFSSCGNLSVDTSEGLKIVYHFQSMPDCQHISGTISVVPSIQDQTIVLLFDNLTYNECLLDGTTIITLTSELTLIHATITLDHMMICGKEINHAFNITYNKITGKLVTAHTLKTIETLFRNIIIQIPSSLTYDAETGVNGSMTIPIHGKSYTCTFNSVKIEKKCGLPLSGTLKINEFEINFNDLSCDNRIINAILDDIEITIEMISDRISNEYQEFLGKMNQFATMIVSRHGLDIEILQQMMLEPSLKSIFQPDSLDFSYFVNHFLPDVFTCGHASISTLPPSIGFSFDGSCNGVTGSVLLSFDPVQIQFDQLSLIRNDCTIDGDMNIGMNIENATFTLTQTTDRLKVCDNILDGTSEIIYGINTPLIINRKGTDQLILNDTEYDVVSDLSYVQNDGLNGSVEFSKDGQSYHCEINNIQFDLKCRIPTSGTITIDRIVIDFSETTCDNLEVNVIIFGQTIKMSLGNIMDLLNL